MPSRGLNIGQSAPEFVLPTPQGVEVSLSGCLLEGPVLLEFLRGTWDPDARRRLTALGEARERFRALQTRVLILACERPETAARYLEEHPTPQTLLMDVDRRVARGYRVLQRLSLPVWNVARPSSFALDRCGFIRYAYVARLQIHSAPLEEIFKALEEIQRATSPARRSPPARGE